MNDKTKNIEQFITSLSKYKDSSELTNLYRGYSKESLIRRENLKRYLEKMSIINPSVLLLGEAPGYKGCRLTGIPFSSEKVLNENDFFKNQGFVCINGIKDLESEISATIVWNELENYPNKPLIWNIFPFHPHKSNDIITNRTPTKTELSFGKEYLKQLLRIFDIKKIIALGRKPESQIYDLDLDFVYVRHPANGGKNNFIDGLRREMK
jgi:hypothetical protein